MLEESVRELRQTCDELESRLDGIDDESRLQNEFFEY